MKAEFDAEAMIENLKKRVSLYKRDLLSFDDLSGYMQALHDIGLLESDDIAMLVSDLTNWRYRHEGKYDILQSKECNQD